MYTNNKTSTAMAQLSAETIKLIAMSYPSILKDRMKTAREPPRESWRLVGLSQAPTVEA